MYRAVVVASEVFGESGGDGLSGVRGSGLIGDITTPKTQIRSIKRLGIATNDLHGDPLLLR